MFLGQPAAPVMSADSAFRFQDVLPDAAYGIAVISDCSTIKASCMLSLSLQSCICVSEVCSYWQYAYTDRTYLALAALAESCRRKNGTTAK